MFEKMTQNVPMRRSPSVDRTTPDRDSLKKDSPAPMLAKLLVDEEPVDITDTPPLSPDSEAAGSTEEPSIEDTTVEEAFQTETTAAEGSAVILEHVETYTEDRLFTDDGDSVSEEESSFRNFFNSENIKVPIIWSLFWMSALGIVVFAYYLNINHTMTAARTAQTSNEFNILIVEREKWDDAKDIVTKSSSFFTDRVVVLQTDSETCDTTATCAKLLNAIKQEQGILNYNFLVATDGCIYEALGWHEPSPLYPDERTVVIAIIGNFQVVAPSAMQLNQLQTLLDVSEELNYLNATYKIFGKKQEVMPSKLFAYVAAFEHWDKDNSDTDEEPIDWMVEPFPIFAD